MGLDYEEEDFYGGDSDDVIENNLEGLDGSDSYEAEDLAPAVHELDVGGLDLSFDDAEDDDSYSSFTPEERLGYYADIVMSCCIGDKEVRQYAIEKVMSFPSASIFKNENHILYKVFHVYRGRLKHIKLDFEFLKLFLNRNRKILEESRGFIDINSYGEIDGSVELGYISGVLKHFKRLESMEEYNEFEFETFLEKYLIEYKSLETARIYSNAQVILQEGMQVGRKKLFGYDDSSNYVKRSLAEMEGTVNIENGTGYTNLRDLLTNETAVKKSYKIGDFDNLEALNKVYGGLYTGMFYQVVAPPKAGKSKFCARAVHTVSVKYGNNVSVWAQEGGKEAFSAQLRAIHFDHIYNSGAGITEKKYGVSQEAILKDNYPSEELKQLELSSKIDLATNPDYGSVDFIDRPFDVETFIESVDTSVTSNNSKMVVIDYLQLIASTTRKTEQERVSEAYKRLLAYCKNKNITVLTPGQYKQATIEKLLDSGSNDAEMRTAGGSSSEVIRTPDVIFALWATTQDLINNSMKVLSVPCRFNKPFPAIDVAVDLEVCNFVSLN